MKKLFIVCVLIISMGLLYSETITHTYNFAQPEIETKDGKSTINIEDCVNLGNEGNPIIPIFGANLLLPQDSEISNIKIISADYELINQALYLEPAGIILPISVPLPTNYQVTPNKDIYSSNEKYPSSAVFDNSTNYLSGHSIGSFSICPIKYYPTQNQVEALSSITVEITTKSSRNADLRSMLKSTKLTSDRIERIVDNPRAIHNYSYSRTDRDEEIDLLLITNNALLNSFNDYIAFKQSTGFITEVALVEDIATEYNGQDLQDKIRNCIIDFYQNKNLQYVILGGDADPQSSTQNIVPHRGFYANPGSDYADNDIPSDMYYGCLDGTWNDDDDNMWGEANEADIFAEVFVGRIAADSPTEVQNQTNKLYMYQNEPVVEDIETFLLMGEYLWPETYGGMYMDELVGFSSSNGYTTNGITENITNNTLYEQNTNWGASQVYNEFNNVGINMLHHLGHSNTEYNMHLYNSDVTDNNFTNDGVTRGYVLGYSQGCYAGAFDNRSTSPGSYMADCISEKLTTIANAEAAFISCSRYGWGQQGSTNGASQLLHRQYTDAIFSEGITTMGAANADSKEDNLSNINSQGVVRWCAYETNLFGDPTLDVWTANPEDMIVNHNPSLSIGVNEIIVTTNATNARIALTQSGVLIGRGVTDDFGIAVVETFEPISNPEIISVSAIAHNKNRYSGEILVLTDQPYVIFDSLEINDENQNEQVDYNESVTLDISMENVGTEPASNVNVILTTESEYITITDDNCNFGDIAANNATSELAAYAFDVTGQVPDLQNVLFTLVATGTSGEDWTSTFNVVLNAPDLNNTELVVSDITGNNNNLLDPGETVQINMPALNTGHSTSSSVEATLSSSNTSVTINNPTIELGTLTPESSTDAVFEVIIGEDIEIGTNITFTYSLDSSFYSFERSITLSVGLIIEDFEHGNLDYFDWQQGANGFEISNGAISGDYCIVSEDIDDNQDASIEIDMTVNSDGQISFFRKVSCEDDNQDDYDYLAFYIDGTEQGRWDGEEGWVEVTFDVTAGDHTFMWKYHKDPGVSSGADSAWIDHITFPSVSFELPPTISVDVLNFDLELGSDVVHEDSFTISNIGTGILEYDIASTPAWLNLSSTSGNLDTGEMAEINVEINTSGLALITYNSSIVITDDFDNEIVIPVMVNVSNTSSDDMLPLVTELSGNYPNPFNPTTTIKFALATDDEVNLEIYNIKGQKVITLLNNQMEAGYHNVVWDGKDASNKQVSSGIFFYRFSTNSMSKTKKMMILK